MTQCCYLEDSVTEFNFIGIEFIHLQLLLLLICLRSNFILPVLRSTNFSNSIHASQREVVHFSAKNFYLVSERVNVRRINKAAHYRFIN